MMACWRWVMSACAVDSVLLVRKGWCRQTVNSSSLLARSRTRRTTSRAVTGVAVEAKAVRVASATSASLISSPVRNQNFFGYFCHLWA